MRIHLLRKCQLSIHQDPLYPKKLFNKCSSELCTIYHVIPIPSSRIVGSTLHQIHVNIIPSLKKFQPTILYAPLHKSNIIEEYLVNNSPCSPSMRILCQRKGRMTLFRDPHISKTLLEEVSTSPLVQPYPVGLLRFKSNFHNE